MLQARYIRCGKGCKKCPHGAYVYFKYREGTTVKSKYLGKLGDAKTLEKIRELAREHPKVMEEYEKMCGKVNAE